MKNLALLCIRSEKISRLFILITLFRIDTLVLNLKRHIYMYQIFSFIALGIGLTFSGYFLGNGLQFFKTGSQRAVTVKGISQKTVEADNLKVEIRFWDRAEEASALLCSAAEWEKTVVAQLEKAGFKSEEILIIPAEIHEHSKNIKDLDKNIIDEKKEFKLEQRIIAVSKNLDIAKNIPEHINVTSMNGIKYNLDLQYEYTDLDAIRPEMIAESLVSAQKAAFEFAKASKAKVGKISKANQGRFTITSPSTSNEYDRNEPFSKMKKVRVVSNVTFDLD